MTTGPAPGNEWHNPPFTRAPFRLRAHKSYDDDFDPLLELELEEPLPVDDEVEESFFAADL